MRPEPRGADFRCEDTLEREVRARGYRVVAGVDEAGRGALFGPVVAAAAALSPERPIEGLNDSKQLTPARREELAVLIRERAICWAVASVDAATIDQLNIYQAARLAMKLAVERLNPAADYLLVDAARVDSPLPQESLIKGDARCQAIAAASILAKVHRDACMLAWHSVYPKYGLAAHKGYGTVEHQRALDRYGVTPLHRLSFEPVRERTLFPAGRRQLELFAGLGAL
jgi:ribonuclease HII